jgi:CDGSH-type Zn-finger protein/uncharacterized Fe-S cluster protein YjdI
MTDRREYRGAGVVISYDAKRCIHAGECVRGAPEVFDPKAKPWIQPERGSAARLIEVVARCPTGALAVTDEGGRSLLEASAANEARLAADGPVHLRGELQVFDAGGQPLATDTRIALCRCGASNNKPFCDNSHQGAGFKHDGTCGKAEGGTAAAAGALKITLTRNGPARCDGPLTLADAFGDDGWRGGQCWLCRCGASQNKPFCDGSHKRVGFVG